MPSLTLEQMNLPSLTLVNWELIQSMLRSISITFHDITNVLPMHSIVFYKILLIIKRMTTTTVAYSKLSINM